MSKLSLVVEMKAAPGQRQALVKEFLDVLPDIHAEDGCELYSLHLAKEDPDLIVIMEQWTTAEAQEVHAKTEHMNVLRERTTHLRSDSASLLHCEPAQD